MYQNGDIWKVKLHPVRDSEQNEIRPCLIVGPNSMNDTLNTIIVLPMTTSKKDWLTRIDIQLDDKEGQACDEHIRSLSKSRFHEKLGKAKEEEMATVHKTLQSTFSL